MLSIQDIKPTILGDIGRGESSRSYQYSPHLLYSPHILYPAGALYGIYPEFDVSNQTSLNEVLNPLSQSNNIDILPIGDNKDIRP